MFRVITDSGSNLTEDLIRQYKIEMVSFRCMIDDEEYMCYEDGREDTLDGKMFYSKIRNGADVRTSLINPDELFKIFGKYLSDGEDVLFICMSSQVTGTYQSACIAAQDLSDEYPNRNCMVVDSLCASLGEGILAIKASMLRNEGYSLVETVDWIEKNKLKMRGVFTVEDLKYLKKGGRITGAAAILGTALNIKPLLYASEEGKIEKYKVARGRKKALDQLIEDYRVYAVQPENELIGIAHCDCQEDAEYLAEQIKKVCVPQEIIIRYYDRCSGAHVGPGAICLFFMGKDRGYKE